MVGRVFLGRYQTIRRLAEGGMGTVYLARQLDLGRHVVIKVMNDQVAADPRFRERFQRETLLMARFQHPYAVALYDASLDSEQGPCIVMEYIRGTTLDELLVQNKGQLAAPRVGRLLGQLCEVLQAAHEQGIIHRDLKPANLMVVDPDTPYEKMKVMDFGLAKLRGRPASKAATTDGDFAVGTPAYICPEQIRGEEMDHRGDLYSVGVILYELLTGKVPFAGKSTMDMLLAQATEQAPSFAEACGTIRVPRAVEEVVLCCLAKDPAQRPASARELSERFRDALAADADAEAEPVQAPEPLALVAVEDAPSLLQEKDAAVLRYMQAWMPQAVATHKLRGFVQDAGGEVQESVPGQIRVRLGRGGTPYEMNGGPLSWLGIGRMPAVDIVLQLRPANGARDSLLNITVAMRAAGGKRVEDPRWLARCERIYCDLRAYLMAQDCLAAASPS